MAETRDHIRALADLFLTGGRSSPAHRAAERHPLDSHHSTVEVILVGHLPVRAGLWLTQYADDVAREEGATALIRLDTEQVILEILRGSESAATASAAATLEEAIASAGPQILRWIVRPALDERMTSLLEAGPDVITILSGADEAAIVSAYRTVKELFDAATRLDAPLPAIELAILGADPVAAQQAAESISDTADLHLGIKVPLRRRVRAMGSLGSTLHFRFPSEHAMPLPALLKSLSAQPVEAPTVAPADETNYAARAADVIGAAQEEEVPVKTQSPQLHRMRSLVTPIGHGGFGVPSFATAPSDMDEPQGTKPPAATTIGSGDPMRLRPKLEVQVEPKQVAPHPPARQAPPATALATWIKGLALLPVRCPDAPDVEIAVDTTGALHVIAWEDRLRALSQVTVWLRKHRDLVSMACPDHMISGVEGIASHLVTSEPKQVADLYGSDLHLHLLAPVEIEGKAGWYSAALTE